MSRPGIAPKPLNNYTLLEHYNFGYFYDKWQSLHRNTWLAFHSQDLIVNSLPKPLNISSDNYSPKAR